MRFKSRDASLLGFALRKPDGRMRHVRTGVSQDHMCGKAEHLQGSEELSRSFVDSRKFLFRFSERYDYLSRSRSHQGALRDRHECGKRDAMDVLAARTIVVRTNVADTDGEIVWSWPPDAEAKGSGNRAAGMSKCGKWRGEN
jgi:hypothetical protein